MRLQLVEQAAEHAPCKKAERSGRPPCKLWATASFTLTISLSAAIVEPYDFAWVDVLMWGIQAVQGTFQYGLVVPLESFSWP